MVISVRPSSLIRRYGANDGTGLAGSLAPLDVVVLSDGEDDSTSGTGRLDRGDPVVRPGREVDHDRVDVGKSGEERIRGTDRTRLRTGSDHEVPEPRRPDEVVREDRDPHRQPSASAR